MVTAECLRAMPSLPDAAFRRVRMRTIFDCCKWDPQVEDVSVLAPFVLVIDPQTWRDLSRLAERLAAETLAAEHELCTRPKLLRRLGLHRRIRRAIGGVPSTGVARVMRFDFHLTRDGWRITEVNSDVPGGFIEASGFTALMAEHHPGARTAGDPAAMLAEALSERLGRDRMVGLVHATAYTDDRQVMIFLSRVLERAGLRTCLLAPDQIRWIDGDAHLDTECCRERADALVRFFPGEWLPNLPRRSAWQHFFAGARTPLCNPATALLTQTKRFPLVWDDLRTDLSNWRSLLPETRDPRDTDWRRSDDWVVKPALGRVGDAIGMRGVTSTKEWQKISRWIFFRPSLWAAQRRFDAIPIETDRGDVYPCIGVYTIDGRAAGIYGRASPAPLINHCAQDVAVFVAGDSNDSDNPVHEREPTDAQRATV